MTTPTSPQPCAHKGCRCAVPPGQTYCGPHCANASTEVVGETTETACRCGHATCNGPPVAELQA